MSACNYLCMVPQRFKFMIVKTSMSTIIFNLISKWISMLDDETNN